jgi:peroxiredoxin
MKHPLLIKAGDQAKNFSLKDQNDKIFDLYENMEKRVLLSFHPLAWTEYCAAQMKSLEDNMKCFCYLTPLQLVSVLIPYRAKKHGRGTWG